jgi:hypothetical protein
VLPISCISPICLASLGYSPQFAPHSLLTRLSVPNAPRPSHPFSLLLCKCRRMVRFPRQCPGVSTCGNDATVRPCHTRWKSLLCVWVSYLQVGQRRGQVCLREGEFSLLASFASGSIVPMALLDILRVRYGRNRMESTKHAHQTYIPRFLLILTGPSILLNGPAQAHKESYSTTTDPTMEPSSSTLRKLPRLWVLTLITPNVLYTTSSIRVKPSNGLG